jgi:ribose transport system substrate-binding protein
MVARATSLIALLLTGALLLAACGDEADSNSGAASPSNAAAANEGVQTARKIVATAQQPQEWKAPGPAFDASAADGASVWFVGDNLQIPFNAGVVSGLKDALGEVGATLRAFDGKGQISEQTKGIEQAIGQGADLIVIGGIPYTLLKAHLQEAKAAGIPVVIWGGWSPGTRPDDVPESVVAGGSHSYINAGTWMADWIVADSGGSANVGLITVSDAGLLAEQVADSVTAELERLCDDCTVETLDARIPQWSDLARTVPSFLRAHPDVDYLAPLFDGMVPFIVPGLRTAGATDDVCIATFNGTPAVLELMQRGGSGVCADVGAVSVPQGWGLADQVLRVIAGEPPVADDDIKAMERLITKDTIGDLDLAADQASWYTDEDYQQRYRELWGATGA